VQAPIAVRDRSYWELSSVFFVGAVSDRDRIRRRLFLGDDRAQR
jgi:hypothetical protein